MAGELTSEWHVINRLLALTIGSHRGRSWSLGCQREAAFEGIWNDLVRSVVGGDLKVVADSNQNTACVFEVRSRRASLFVSTVLPYFIAWSASERQYLDRCPEWAASLLDAGFSYLGSSSTRTLSPYRDEDADRRLTYFEILFEWIEGSDGLPQHELIDPWVPHRDAVAEIGKWALP